MSAVIASLVAVAGTLLGSFSTYWFQQRSAERSEASARRDRLRQDRLTACSEFAAAVFDLRRAVVAVWFRRNRRAREPADDRSVSDYRVAYAEADRLGAAAQSARFRMLLVVDDPGLRELSDTAVRHVDAILSAPDKAKVEALDAEFEEHLSAFVSAAARLLD